MPGYRHKDPCYQGECDHQEPHYGVWSRSAMMPLTRRITLWWIGTIHRGCGGGCVRGEHRGCHLVTLDLEDESVKAYDA